MNSFQNKLLRTTSHFSATVALLNRGSQEREKSHTRLTAAALSSVLTSQNLFESTISSVFFVRRQYSLFAAMYLKLATVSL